MSQPRQGGGVGGAPVSSHHQGGGPRQSPEAVHPVDGLAADTTDGTIDNLAQGKMLSVAANGEQVGETATSRQ